jgi:hypothetical protein
VRPCLKKEEEEEKMRRSKSMDIGTRGRENRVRGLRILR